MENKRKAKITFERVVIISSFVFCIIGISFIIFYLVKFDKVSDFLNKLKDEEDSSRYDIVMGVILPGLLSIWFVSVRKNYLWIKRALQYWKLDLQGPYYTEYQDYIKKKHTIIKERIHIYKHGLSLSWKSDFESQSWKFNGTLEDRLIKGEYLPYSILDSGKGSFLLQADHENTLLGVWMGFSHTNQLVSQGMYYLKKVPQIVIENYDPSFMKVRLAKMIAETSVEAVSRNSAFLKDCEGSQARVAVVFSDSKGKRITKSATCKNTASKSVPLLGAAIWSQKTLEEISQKLEIDYKLFPEYMHYADSIALVNYLGIDKNYANQGVEGEIVQDLLQTLQPENCQVAVVLLEENNENQKTYLLDLISENLLNEDSLKRPDSSQVLHEPESSTTGDKPELCLNNNELIANSDNENNGSNTNSECINSELNPIIYGKMFADELKKNGFKELKHESIEGLSYKIYIGNVCQ